MNLRLPRDDACYREVVKLIRMSVENAVVIGTVFLLYAFIVGWRRAVYDWCEVALAIRGLFL